MMLAGGGMLAAGGLALDAVDQIGTENRERHATLDRLDLGIARVDTGDAGPEGQRAIRGAIGREASRSNLSGEDILGGINRAQERFSALDTAEHRATYLNTVLPELTRVAVGTNTQLADVVDTAGELQRQLNIAPTALPDTLAQMIVMGRQGSIGFTDMSRHLGELGGMTSRFMRNTGADSAHANALTGSLFQFAGRAGGSGDEAATRARGFLSNFTSARGQARLTGVLGQSALDAHGQLRAGAGQSQDDAFIRLLETVFARTGGNSGRFLTAVAGTDEQGRALGDQLFRDLAAHGGHLADFRALNSGAVGATAANTQGAMFDRVMGTPEAQRERAANERLFDANNNELGRAAEETRRLRERLERSGVGGQLANRMIDRVPLVGGVMDLVNVALHHDSRPAVLGTDATDPAARSTRLYEMWTQARVQASAEYRGSAENRGVLGMITRTFGDTDRLNSTVNARAAEIFNQRVEQDRNSGRDPTAAINLGPATMSAMTIAVRDGMVAAIQGAAGGVPGAGGAGVVASLGGGQ